ncbi:unnamed protein product [Prorocentrum cordatum]|uniref:Uncharacterized protein n=1 Tax=Prorocentrum cordatum TaxID=2364126 RepID=A0ABN9ST21_9DINO|nr:unnamed protein product [Polarella glacialis]
MAAGWMDWGRSFELKVKGMEPHEEIVADITEWETWGLGFKGGLSEARGRGGKMFLTGPKGRPVCGNMGHYEPSDEDFPLTIQSVCNRHGCTTLVGEEATSSAVLDGIADCCSMSIMSEMQRLELNEWKKADELLRKYEEPITTEMTGALIREVRTLLNDAVNVTRCAFSRVLIYGACFCGVHIHFQVTYSFALRSGSEQCPDARDALWLGICSTLVSMLMVFMKFIGIARYLKNVWRIVWHFDKVLSAEQPAKTQYKSMHVQIAHSRRRLLRWSSAMLPACSIFCMELTW